MGKISGKAGYVQYNGITIAEMVDWAISGSSIGVIKKTPAFGDTMIQKVADGIIEPGTISFKGNYDPADTGQTNMAAALTAGLGIYGLYLYVAAATWWHVGTGGTIIVTKSKGVSLSRTTFGTIDFAGEVEGAEMVQVGTGS